MPTIPLSSGTTTPYCTPAEARAAGAVGNDADVELAIAQATARIEAFTGEFFTPRVLTVVARCSGDGRAMLPHRLTDSLAVQEVRDHVSDMVVPTVAYRAYTSAISGDVDAIGVGAGHVAPNYLVLGLEPWNRWDRPERLRVTATFGYAECPTAVEMATAHLAAWLSRQIVHDDDGNPATPVPAPASQTDPEGNVVPVVPGFNADDEETTTADVRTTGLRSADALLVPFRRLRTLTAV